MQKFQINATPAIFLLKHGKVIHKYGEEYINSFRLNTVDNAESILYVSKHIKQFLKKGR